MRLPEANDTRLLVVGVVAVLALVAYLGVAFANTHPTAAPAVSQTNKVAPWTPYGSNLVPVPRRRHGGWDVRVAPAGRVATALGSYGALAPTLVPEPTPGARFVVGLWLRASRRTRIGVQLHLFRSGVPSRYLVDTTVQAARRWRRYTFRGRVKGSWVGLSMYVFRPANVAARPSFAIRGVTVNLH